jgi:hypothetical protein
MSQPPAAEAPAVFDHRVSDSHVELYWTCSQPQLGMLQVDGVVRSPWIGGIRFADVEVVGVDAQGHAVAAVKAPVRDVILHTNSSSPFQAVLRTTGREARADLYYEYYRPAERDSGFGFGLGRSEEYERSFVRDACGPDQHRAR